jgi:hypothetical protein
MVRLRSGSPCGGGPSGCPAPGSRRACRPDLSGTNPSTLIGYTGALTDTGFFDSDGIPETGYVHDGDRWYNPDTSAFTTTQLDNPANANPYPYAADKPTNNTNPTGQCSGVHECADDGVFYGTIIGAIGGALVGGPVTGGIGFVPGFLLGGGEGATLGFFIGGIVGGVQDIFQGGRSSEIAKVDRPVSRPHISRRRQLADRPKASS